MVSLLDTQGTVWITNSKQNLQSSIEVGLPMTWLTI